MVEFRSESYKGIHKPIARQEFYYAVQYVPKNQEPQTSRSSFLWIAGIDKRIVKFFSAFLLIHKARNSAIFISNKLLSFIKKIRAIFLGGHKLL